MSDMADSDQYKVRRAAAREAAYGPLLNPIRRARTWVSDGNTTPTGMLGRSYELERVTSAPIESIRRLDINETATKENHVEEVTVGNQRTERPPSEELKARRRFIARFKKKSNQEKTGGIAEEEPKKARKVLKHKPFTFGNQLRATIFNSPLNILLLAVPAGFVVNYLHLNPIAVFFVNFGAILPLTTLFSYAIDELRLRYRGIGGMLIYMSFGNAVLLICSLFLLTSNQVETLKTSLVGNILTTNLLNTGIAFCAGGAQRQEQFFNKDVARTMKTLLLVTVIALALPTASALLSATSTHIVTQQSRGTAFILIVTYCLFLQFEFGTHKVVFNRVSRKVKVEKKMKKASVEAIVSPRAIREGLVRAGAMGAAQGRPRLADPEDELVERLIRADKEDGEVEARLHLGVCFAVLIIGSAMMAFNSQFMTESIKGLTIDAGVPRDFIGLVLLPILSNDLAAIQLAVHDEMDLAIHAALGKSLQVTLVVTPILVIVGWGAGIEAMNLLFDGFQVVALFASVLLVQIGIEAGKSNWLTGATFALVYVMIGIASWFQGSGPQV